MPNNSYSSNLFKSGETCVYLENFPQQIFAEVVFGDKDKVRSFIRYKQRWKTNQWALLHTGIWDFHGFVKVWWILSKFVPNHVNNSIQYYQSIWNPLLEHWPGTCNFASLIYNTDWTTPDDNSTVVLFNISVVNAIHVKMCPVQKQCVKLKCKTIIGLTS